MTNEGRMVSVGTVGHALLAEFGTASDGDSAAPSRVFSCAACEDSGMVVAAFDGRRSARTCDCMRERGARRRLKRADIPRRYEGATLAGFKTVGADPSIGFAARLMDGLVREYPCCGRGVLLVGTCGVGKTHLAAAALRALVMERGATGRFWDLSDLLVQIRRSYGPSNAVTMERETIPRSEGSLVDELARVDVLVLDEIGAQRFTDWSFEQVSMMLGQRYNANRLTICTTNYPNLGPGSGARGIETLGDRVGARVFSRLGEMCRPVEMVGADFRVRRAG